MSGSQEITQHAPRHGKPVLSIRARLIVLALLAITPLMLERVRGLENARAEQMQRASSEVVRLARRGIAAQRETIESSRALVQIISRAYAKMPAASGGCNQYIADLTADIAWLRDISIAGTDGRIVCSTEASAVGLNVSDRRHFQEVLKTREFGLSDYLIDRLHQAPSIVAAFPVIRDDGALDGAVLAVINLQWIDALAASAAAQSGVSVQLLDDTGKLIAASADQQAFIGRRFAADPLVKNMLTEDEGMVTAPGFDGVPRVYAYARVPWTQARLAVGLAESAIHSGIDREIDLAYLQLVAFGLFVLLLAWFGGEQLVVRPIRSLVRTATRFGRGDLHVRATQEPWVAEFAPLAAALDDMAAKLAAREAELQIVNQHLEALATLDGLTGLANRRAFDRHIEHEWHLAGAAGTPLALLMVDIDHFKQFNDRYGHVAGDACLRNVGETLSRLLPENAGLVARYGGEEFAVVLPRLATEAAAALAEKARRAVESLYIDHSESSCGHVTISIGVESLVPQKYQTASELIQAADIALYAAKRRGRNTVVSRIYTPLRAA